MFASSTPLVAALVLASVALPASSLVVDSENPFAIARLAGAILFTLRYEARALETDR